MRKSVLATIEAVRPFVPVLQLKTLVAGLRGEEREFFRGALRELEIGWRRRTEVKPLLLETMPHNNQGNNMNTPHIGQPWPEQDGIYAGIARGFDGEPDGHIILLDDRPPDKKTNWKNAVVWAASLGNGSRLPTRFEAALIGANIGDKISQPGFYWSASEYSTAYAWYQYWGSGSPGYQFSTNKTDATYVRAVRRLIL